MINKESLVRARSNYAHVPARLLLHEGAGGTRLWGRTVKAAMPSQDEWTSNPKPRCYSSWTLDDYHRVLLNSDDGGELLLGLASTVFWGYASGTDGVLRPDQAMAKVATLADGNDNGVIQDRSVIVSLLKITRDHLRHSQTGAALKAAMQIKFLGMSFASKVVTFMSPTTHAVYDDVVYSRLRNGEIPEFQLAAIDPATTANVQRKAEAYEGWCAHCCTVAGLMNERHADMWTDWDGRRHSWRAVDVERAFCSSGRSALAASPGERS